MGRLIDIEGIDGVGKETQVKLLKETLIRRGMIEDKDFCTVSFPRYGTPGCTMVERYLKGEFGENPNDVNPYLASTFYSIDRATSMKNDNWMNVYNAGGIVIADRYTSSNIIHQGSKLSDEYNEKDQDNKARQYVNWLERFEYEKLGLPKPDVVIYLTAPIDLIKDTIIERKLSKLKDSSKRIFYVTQRLYQKCIKENQLIPGIYMVSNECDKEKGIITYVTEITHDAVRNKYNESYITTSLFDRETESYSLLFNKASPNFGIDIADMDDDIHEDNFEYLERCSKFATSFASTRRNWYILKIYRERLTPMTQAVYTDDNGFKTVVHNRPVYLGKEDENTPTKYMLASRDDINKLIKKILHDNIDPFIV